MKSILQKTIPLLRSTRLAPLHSNHAQLPLRTFTTTTFKPLRISSALRQRKPAPENESYLSDDPQTEAQRAAELKKKQLEEEEEAFAKAEAEKDQPFRQEIGFAALPDTFVKFLKITFVGLSILLAVKLFVNNRKSRQFKPDHMKENNGGDSISENSVAVEDHYGDTSRIRPGFPLEASTAQRKSEYEGAGNSYSSRRSGDKFSR